MSKEMSSERADKRARKRQLLKDKKEIFVPEDVDQNLSDFLRLMQDTKNPIRKIANILIFISNLLLNYCKSGTS